MTKKTTPSKATLRYRATATLLPMITVTVQDDAVQLSIPYKGDPSAVSLAYRIAARAIDLGIGAAICEGRVEIPDVVVNRWCASVRIDAIVAAFDGPAIARALESAANAEARAGGRPTHRVVRS